MECFYRKEFLESYREKLFLKKNLTVHPLMQRIFDEETLHGTFYTRRMVEQELLALPVARREERRVCEEFLKESELLYIEELRAFVVVLEGRQQDTQSHIEQAKADRIKKHYEGILAALHVALVPLQQLFARSFLRAQEVEEEAKKLSQSILNAHGIIKHRLEISVGDSLLHVLLNAEVSYLSALSRELAEFSGIPEKQ